MFDTLMTLKRAYTSARTRCSSGGDYNCAGGIAYRRRDRSERRNQNETIGNNKVVRAFNFNTGRGPSTSKQALTAARDLLILGALADAFTHELLACSNRIAWSRNGTTTVPDDGTDCPTLPWRPLGRYPFSNQQYKLVL